MERTLNYTNIDKIIRKTIGSRRLIRNSFGARTSSRRGAA
jgi:hypothetical protein